MNILEMIAKAKEEKAKSLELNGLDLRILPDDLFDLEFLEELSLDENMLVELPEEIGNLKNLKK